MNEPVLRSMHVDVPAARSRSAIFTERLAD